MEDESSGAQKTQGEVGQSENQQQGGQAPGVGAQPEPKQDQQEPQKDAVSGGGGDYVAQLKAKDTEIETLQAKVAEAAKTAEATGVLGKEIADLKTRLADEHTEFALRSAGAQSVTAAKALLAEHDGDVAALVKAEPWLFETKGSSQGGATGLEPAGASGESDGHRIRRWGMRQSVRCGAVTFLSFFRQQHHATVSNRIVNRTRVQLEHELLSTCSGLLPQKPGFRQQDYLRIDELSESAACPAAFLVARIRSQCHIEIELAPRSRMSLKASPYRLVVHRYSSAHLYLK